MFTPDFSCTINLDLI
jgi:hypothetical protein